MRALIISIPQATSSDVELASDQLWELGVRAIEERWDGDAVELWTAAGDGEEATARVAARLDGRWAWRFVTIATEAVETWRDFAVPMWVNSDLVVVPAWQEHSFDGNPLAVHIEPGAAFGLGDHPTTELSLRSLVSSISEISNQAPSVLDVGCGTGVLAITAARLGANHVRAVDVASAAVEATIDNAARNDVADLIDVDTTSVVDLVGSYDIVVANILAPVLVSIADALRRLTASGGHLIVSGILADSHDHVLQALSPMKVVQSEAKGDWIAVTLTH
jgi:ribosomal protein L11 methyltransferase